jgi:polysaccharide export outer membrane protein
MKRIARRTLETTCIAAFAGLLCACGTVAPGFSPGAGLSPVPAAAAGTGTGNGKTSSYENVDAQFREITPQLVQAEQQERRNRTSQDLGKLMTPAEPYTIENGDVLSIVVWDHPELNGNAGATPASTAEAPSGAIPSAGFTVDASGQIQFPYAGVLKVSGLTQDEARKQLAAKLARYINKPNVTLQVQSYRSRRIYVDGEVKQPGVLAINDIPMTLVEALNRVGGMLATADQSRLLLVRQEETYAIDLPQLVQRGVNPASIMLKNGDVLRVRSRDESKVFVSGEVIAPRSLTMHNGRLSLNEALGEAGGINPMSGDASQIYIVRRNLDQPVVYKLDAHAPGALAMAEGFELDPKDLVYVAATPLANWHRTISQVLPGALSSAVSAAHVQR